MSRTDKTAPLAIKVAWMQRVRTRGLTLSEISGELDWALYSGRDSSQMGTGMVAGLAKSERREYHQQQRCRSRRFCAKARRLRDDMLDDLDLRPTWGYGKRTVRHDLR